MRVLRLSMSNRATKKKPTWTNTLRHSTTSAYSLTGHQAQPGYPLFSHPIFALTVHQSQRGNVHCNVHSTQSMSATALYDVSGTKAIGLSSGAVSNPIRTSLGS